MKENIDIMEVIESLPEWERASFIRELIPVLNLNDGLLMEEIIEHDRDDMAMQLAEIEDHEFVRMYLDEHDGDIDLQEEIADRREFEWEYPEYRG